jgi:hypothetical protein
MKKGFFIHMHMRRKWNNCLPFCFPCPQNTCSCHSLNSGRFHSILISIAEVASQVNCACWSTYVLTNCCCYVRSPFILAVLSPSVSFSIVLSVPPGIPFLFV